MNRESTSAVVMMCIAQTARGVSVWNSHLHIPGAHYAPGRQRNTGVAKAKRKARKARRK